MATTSQHAIAGAAEADAMSAALFNGSYNLVCSLVLELLKGVNESSLKLYAIKTSTLRHHC